MRAQQGRRCRRGVPTDRLTRSPGRSGTPPTVGGPEQFADTLRTQLREPGRRRRHTQAELAARTNGLVLQAAVANYESGHRAG